MPGGNWTHMPRSCDSDGCGGAVMAQTGGGATLAGTVKDGSGGVVAGAKVTVVNTGTSFVRDGITLRSAEAPRVDIVLEAGSLAETVTVAGSAPLLNTETVVSGYFLPQDVLPNIPGLMKRTVYLVQYMPGAVGIVGQAGFQIAGQAQNAIGRALDGVNSKPPYAGNRNWVHRAEQSGARTLKRIRDDWFPPECGKSRRQSPYWGPRAPLWGGEILKQCDSRKVSLGKRSKG